VSAVRRGLPAAVTLAAAAVIAQVALGRALAREHALPAAASAGPGPSASVVRLVDLGHHGLAADLITASANVAFGAALAARTRAPGLERDLTTAAELDPGACGRYRRGAAMLVYGGGEITVAAVEAADRLLARGAAACPGAWEIWFQLGFDQLFELPRLAAPDDPRQPRWRRAGMTALARAARLPGAPAWLAGWLANAGTAP
jgi:hypothetical protein